MDSEPQSIPASTVKGDEWAATKDTSTPTKAGRSLVRALEAKKSPNVASLQAELLTAKKSISELEGKLKGLQGEASENRRELDKARSI